MRKLFGLSIMAILAVACATQPSLKDYQAKSLDEEKIVNLVIKFQEGYSSQNAEGILATYSPGAMIKTATKEKDWSGVMLPKEEHAAILSKQMSFYKRANIKLEIAPPRELRIKENEASMVAPYELYSRNPYRAYVESGVIDFEFKETDSGWLISRRTWEISDCNHPDFKDWKKKQP